MVNKIVAFISTYFKVVFILLCLLTILPFFLTCLYIQPFFDDYIFANQINAMGIFGFIKYFYLNWSGRYSEVICMSVINARIQDASNMRYVLLSISILIALFCSFFYLMHILLKDFCSVIHRVLITLFVFVFYLVFIPELFTSFYWYCSSFYQLCFAFIIFNIGLIINLFKKEKGIVYKTGLLTLNIFIAGFSEITIFSFTILYLSIFIYRYFKYKKVDPFWMLLCVVFIVFGALNICAPGNFVRMHVTHKGVNPGFIFCSVRAVYDLILFHGIYIFFKTSFLLFCLLFIPQGKAYIQSVAFPVRILNVHPLYAILVTLLIFYLQHALSLYGAGYSLQGRVLNFSVFLFYMAFAYNLLIIYNHFPEKSERLSFKVPVITQKITLLVMLLFFNMSDNNRLLWGDLCRELPGFHEELGQRYALIENAKRNGATEVEVPPVKANPKLYIFGEEAKCKTTSFVNEQKYLDQAASYFRIKLKIK